MSTHDERSPLGGPQNVLPASQYLQARLNERRARNTRPKRARHTDFGPQKRRDDDIFLNEAEASRKDRMFDSSPVVASSRASDAGSASRRRTLGLRDMDDQMDQLSKQNFDLKMELDHRRQQTLRMQQQIESMVEQVERAQMVEHEHKELLRINSQLVEELEKRDRAVEEAMDIICDLEDRVAEYDERTSQTRPSTANADSGYAGTETQEHEPPSSPPELNAHPKTPHIRPAVQASAASHKLQGLLNGQTPAKPRREPSILSQQKPSTNALRSVYMESAQKLHPVKSFQSLLSKQEARTDDGDDILNSPRLSVLSESSFPSIYSPKQASPDRYPWEDTADDAAPDSAVDSRDRRRHHSIKRVSQWISEHGTTEATPSKSNNLSTPLADGVDDRAQPSRTAVQDDHSQSLNDALVSAAAKSPNLLQDPGTSKQSATRARKQRPVQQHRPTSFAGPIFGEPMLPPTPDSASTRMLRASRSSNIADDRSLLDTTPAPIKQEALVRGPESGLRTAPRQMRSSVELRHAFASNLHYRNGNLDGQLHDDDDSDEDYDADAQSEIIRDISLDYDGYPDGKSIVMGTPSRFLKHARPPVGEMPFGGNDTSPTVTAHSPPQRRRSSDQIISSPTKPRLGRVETSPTIFSSLGRIVSGGKKAPAARASDESVTSPHSVHSGSSSNRTVVANEPIQEMAEVPREGARLTSGLASPTRSRASPSPGRSLSQRTAGLFRRLSNSQGEKPPLPTLTSAPSSTFANNPPAELRRPKTSHSADRPLKSSAGTTVARPPSAREARRPSLQTRTKTEPATARSRSPAATDRTDKEKRSIFTRSNSVKKSAEANSDTQSARGLTKRRGSLREAVSTARRPWR
ncbi:hypothetical protein M409DRAFT_18118 [Zasmidium cellare ATCC 36951]|uniref:Uncharacterized protein n=1 Tax=Zasmidium cellare ATCC 36951 TaxID=1080233 RepID=A0A6A6CXE5_ZASCE|nr:uncharacterized protein M409DRAFT_18118 [Zasmidium cellare ATCC 36951]KAF2171887.1 hypothetical protein M409DRAFT_18118 [Zasmidium cellare ATCC 36951]